MVSLKIGGIIVAAFITGAFIASPELRAYAANTVGSSDIINESILSVDIKNGEVKNSDIANGAVSNSKIGAGAVSNSKLATNSVSSSKITDGTITLADLSQSFVKIEHRDDCNCGGTGWDPDGTKNYGFIYDSSVTPYSAVHITMVGYAGFNVINCGVVTQGGSYGYFVVNCNRAIPSNVGINYAVFNKS